MAPPTIAVVGGGPGGLMAAEVLATAGAAVTVFDRMPSVGRKLLLAGRGGLNLTHTEERKAFLARYGRARPRLEAAIDAFDPAALRAWCEGLGQPTFVGSSGRVFPEAFRATPLLRAWLRRLDDLGVVVRTRHAWQGWDGSGLVFTDAGGARVSVSTHATILALGGATWPRVGSDGSWVAPARAAGIGVVPLRPANCGFVAEWSAPFTERFAGASLKNVRLAHAGVEVRGDTTITTLGIEGGALHVVSGAVRDEIDARGSATVTVDLHPDLTVAAVRTRLERRRAGDSASTALRRVGLQPVAIGLLREGVTDLPTDAGALARAVKAVPVRLVATQPIARAISTAGGIALDEIDDSFMLRRRPGTFVAGEMLDWEAPTGGYLLQATFSTAVAAAHGALAWVTRPG